MEFKTTYKSFVKRKEIWNVLYILFKENGAGAGFLAHIFNYKRTEKPYRIYTVHLLLRSIGIKEAAEHCVYSPGWQQL